MRHSALVGALVVATGCGASTSRPAARRSGSAPPSPATVERPLASAAPASPAPSRDVAPEEAWPVQPNAQWPRGCLIKWASAHATQPWVALACATAEDDYDEVTGALIVVDAGTGTLRSVTAFDEGVSDFEDRLRWHPDGTRIAVNIGTNGLAIVDRGTAGKIGNPDDGRDHGYDFVFVGARLFLDMGGYFVPGAIAEHEVVEPETAFYRVEYNEAAKVVVGFDRDVLLGLSPTERRRVFSVKTDGIYPRCAHDGLRCSVVVDADNLPKQDGVRPQRLRLFDGANGRQVADITPSGPLIDHITWSHRGRVAFTSHRYLRRGGRAAEHIDIVRDDRLITSIDVGRERVRGGYGVDEGGDLSWSSDGRRLWALLDAKHVVAYDAETGHEVSRMEAIAPPLPSWMKTTTRFQGLRQDDHAAGVILAAGEERVLRIGEHFVSVWTLNGERLATWTAER